MAQAYDSDWQSRKTLSESNQHMLENEICCDVTFLVGDNRKRIKAHKYILVSQSSVFEAMFCGLLAEQGNEIIIPDVPEQTFIDLLRHMYFRETQLKPDTVTSILYAARKYAIGRLEDQVINWLLRNVTTGTVCTILNEAVLYNGRQLELHCLRYVDSHAGAVLASTGFRDLTKDSLLKVVGRDLLQADEEKVFEAVMEWAKAECSRRGLDVCGAALREVLGEAIHMVRFPLMDREYFARQVVDQNVLSFQECTRIFQSLNSVTIPDLEFSSKLRANNLKRVVRFTSRWAVSYGFDARYDRSHVYGPSMVDSIEISCDRPISLRGIGLYGSRDGPGSYSVDLDIEKDGIVVGRTSAVLETFGEEFPHSVLLPEAVPLPVGCKVVIIASIHGPPSFRGTHGRPEVRVDDGYTFTFSRPPTVTFNGSSVETGQIPELYFS